jgi:hypothetical protein
MFFLRIVSYVLLDKEISERREPQIPEILEFIEQYRELQSE